MILGVGIIGFFVLLTQSPIKMGRLILQNTHHSERVWDNDCFLS